MCMYMYVCVYMCVYMYVCMCAAVPPLRRCAAVAAAESFSLYVS